jgi:hypothetical protein
MNKMLLSKFEDLYPSSFLFYSSEITSAFKQFPLSINDQLKRQFDYQTVNLFLANKKYCNYQSGFISLNINTYHGDSFLVKKEF